MSLTRFELFVVVRNQVRRRDLLRRALAVEAALEELAPRLGLDPVAAALAGLGQGIDAELCASNPERRGDVAREILLTEGLPPELADAAAQAHRAPPEQLSGLALALAAALGLVDAAYGLLEDTPLDDLAPVALAARVRRRFPRALACLERLPLDPHEAAEATLAGLRRIRADLHL